eukprot:4120885-Karenia_brevis.AAC.1
MRHNRVRVWIAHTHKACTDVLAEVEQHVPAWDRFNRRTQQVERAVVDVATRVVRDGRVS